MLNLKWKAAYRLKLVLIPLLFLHLVITWASIPPSNSNFPYPIVATFGQGNVASISYQSMSSQTWRSLYCQNGFNQSCFDHLVFKSAANQRVADKSDLGIKMAMSAVNNAVAARLSNQQSALTPTERDQMGLALNFIRGRYAKLRSQALGENLSWDDDASIKSILKIVEAIPGAGFGGTLVKEIINQLDSMATPFKQLIAQGQYAAAYAQAQNMGDVFGDLQLNSRIMKGLSEAVDPFLASWLGITTKQSAASIFESNPALEALFVSKESREMMLKIFNEVRNGKVLTQEGLEQIMSEFQSQQAEASHEIVQTPLPSSDEISYAKNLIRLQNYEDSLKLFSAFGSLLPDGKFKNAAIKTSAIGNAAVAIYKAYLNPQKLGRILLTANIVEAVSGALNVLFNQGPDANALIMEELRGLRQDLYLVDQDIRSGFNISFGKLDSIYEKMIEGFDMVLAGQEDHRLMLSSIYNELSDLRKDLGSLDASMLSYFEDSSKRVSALMNIRCFDQSTYFKRTSLSEAEFFDCGSNLLLVGSNFARDSLATQMTSAEFDALQSNPESLVMGALQTSRRYDLASVHKELSKKDAVGQLNYLAASLFLHTQTDVFPHNESKLSPIPSTYYWIIGSNSFLRLVSENPRHQKLVKKASFDLLANDGDLIQSTLKKLRSAATLKNVIGLIETSQNNFKDSFKSLQKAYTKNGNIEVFNDEFWGPMPQTKALTPSSLSDVIAAQIVQTPKDLPVSYPMNQLPELAKLAVQLGVAKLKIESSVVGDPSSLWNKVWRQETGRQQHRSPRPRDCLPDCPVTWTATGRVNADVEIRTTFFVGDFEALRCTFRNHAPLWIGSYTQYGGDFVETRIVKENRRTFGDVVSSVWEDNNYKIRHRMTCSPSDILSQTELLQNVKNEWTRRQNEFKGFVTGVLARGNISSGFHPSLQDPMREFLLRSNELLSSYEILRNVISVALSPSGKNESPLRDSFFSGTSSFTPQQFLNWFTNYKVESAEKVSEFLANNFKEKNLRLEEELEKTRLELQKGESTLPDVDLMVERLKALKNIL